MLVLLTVSANIKKILYFLYVLNSKIKCTHNVQRYTYSSASGALDVFQKPGRKKLNADAGTLIHLASYAQVRNRQLQHAKTNTLCYAASRYTKTSLKIQG